MNNADTTPGNGGGCGGQGTSVTITEKVGPPDRYAFSPTNVTVSMGQ